MNKQFILTFLLFFYRYQQKQKSLLFQLIHIKNYQNNSKIVLKTTSTKDGSVMLEMIQKFII